jgi:hypothetical protein
LDGLSPFSSRLAINRPQAAIETELAVATIHILRWRR